MLTIKKLKEFCNKAEKEIESDSPVVVMIRDADGNMERMQLAGEAVVGKYDDSTGNFLAIMGETFKED